MPSCFASRDQIASRRRPWTSGPRSRAATSVICHSTRRREAPDCNILDSTASSAAARESSCLLGLHGILANLWCFWMSQPWSPSHLVARVLSPSSSSPSAIFKSDLTLRTRTEEDSRAGSSPASICRRSRVTAAWYSGHCRGAHQPSSPSRRLNLSCPSTKWSTMPTRTRSAAFCSTPCSSNVCQRKATNGQRSHSARSAPSSHTISAISSSDVQKFSNGRRSLSKRGTEASKTHFAALSQTGGCRASALCLLTTTKIFGRLSSSLHVLPTSSPKVQDSLASSPSVHRSRALDTSVLQTLLQVSFSGERVFAQTLWRARR
mmetsp:Transcript_125655/g.391266  ORF Transcript_125655/g.391266 Transcript_125655/m.391266 type:complete len:320 (+) Transcript_125655:269-1228(+)